MSKYFVGLNYSLANEDTTVEYDLLPRGLSSVFSVCGSGSRVIPLLAKDPKELHIVDLSETQLKLFRLRYHAIKHLNYQDYLYLLGYLKLSQRGYTRADLLGKIHLSPEDLAHWKETEAFWIHDGFIYLGKWERHFMNLGRFFVWLTFSDLATVFNSQTMQEQRHYLYKWKPRLFRLYTRIVMNEWVANKLLYKGSFAGGAELRTSELTAAQFVAREFDDLFQNTLVRQNYFLSMIFENSLSRPESFPIECREDVYQAVKHSQTAITFHKGNLLELLKQKPHDFYSLSDTFSYMRDDEVGGFISGLPPGIRTGALIVIRTFMRKPTFSIDLPWTTDPRQNEALAKKDCTRMYDFTVIRKT